MSDNLGLTTTFGHNIRDEEGDDIAVIHSYYDHESNRCFHKINTIGELSTTEAFVLFKALANVLEIATEYEKDNDDGSSPVPAPTAPTPQGPAAEAMALPAGETPAPAKEAPAPSAHDILLKHAAEIGVAVVALWTPTEPPQRVLAVTLENASKHLPASVMTQFFAEGPNPSQFLARDPREPMLIQQPIRAWPLLDFLTFHSSLTPAETPS